ncbi:uncharacterized protein LOC131243184 isoform X3 [Magnolia sinica]|uniref:uncharacterized protein LOC131243184 isoform X3 n=1 Tax=Magnolia sinica TaxID=86752 RepID=UPI002657C1C6|nr:uncharacterized protein LOC131243184 isoform X3 [Magnolia sinica]
MWVSKILTPSLQYPNRSRYVRCRAKAQKKRVAVVGNGWAALGSAHHLSKQGFDVILLDSHGGKTTSYDCVEVGIQGRGQLINSPYVIHKSTYSSIESLPTRKVVLLQDPHVSGTLTVIYFLLLTSLASSLSPTGQDQHNIPQKVWSSFVSLSRIELHHFLSWLLSLTSTTLILPGESMIQNFSTAVTARELFKQFGCSERLYRQVFNPILQVGLFAPAEQCSAAAALGIIYYFILAHQQDFDVMWCRGTLKEKIFMPWLELMKIKGCELHQKRRVTDFSLNEDTGCISEVVCGEVRYAVDAVVLAVGVSTLQSIVMNSWTIFSFVLQARQDFLNIMNLAAIDVLSVRLRLDRNVNIPKASNACFGYDDSSGWTFFDLNAIYDEYRDEPVTILEANFYHANQLLPLKDDQIVAKVMSYLSKCIKEFEQASVLEKVVTRLPKSATHFFPGSYNYMMRGSTTFPNLFMAGDWIINRHGSWSQEKAYVSGLEAANRVIDYLGEGNFAKIIAVEEDEPHFQTLRSFNRSIAEIRAQLPLADFFL